jgi:hypothetical protein
MDNYSIKDAIYITEEARKAWLNDLSFDKNTLKAVSIGLKRFLTEMQKNQFIKNSFDSGDIGMIKMFIVDAETYSENQKITLKTNFTIAQMKFDDAIKKLKLAGQ